MRYSRSRKNCLSHCRSAFSLIELLIVMAILAGLAALTVPAMRGSLDKSRLTGAAKEIQAALAKSRALAIREGTPVYFRYEISGDRYQIDRGPAVDLTLVTVLDDSAAAASTPSGLTVESANSSNTPAGTLTDERSDTSTLREGRLPTGVTFAETPESDMLPTSGTAPGLDQQTPLTGVTRIRRWSEPIRFHASGRTTDRVIRLTGQRSFFVNVTLRGLTATAGHSAPARGPEPDPAAITPEVSGVTP